MAGVAAYAAGLFVHVTRDASKYAALAREIYDTGEFINLKIHGEPYVQKPPLLFWLSALSFHLFGISDLAFKLPLLLFSFAGIFFTFKLGSALYDQKTGVLAALLTASSQISFLYNMDIHTDTLLQSLVTFSLWQFYLFLKNKKTHHLVWGLPGWDWPCSPKGRWEPPFPPRHSWAVCSFPAREKSPGLPLVCRIADPHNPDPPGSGRPL